MAYYPPAGDRDTRITILRRSQKTNEVGEPDDHYEEESRVWAKVEPVISQQRVIYAAQNVNVTYRVTIRYREIAPDSRLRLYEQDYEIVQKLPTDSKRHTLTLLITEAD